MRDSNNDENQTTKKTFNHKQSFTVDKHLCCFSAWCHNALFLSLDCKQGEINKEWRTWSIALKWNIFLCGKISLHEATKRYPFSTFIHLPKDRWGGPHSLRSRGVDTNKLQNITFTWRTLFSAQLGRFYLSLQMMSFSVIVIQQIHAASPS